MKLNKVTTGFVIQTYDTRKKRFVSQEFVAGDQVDYENRYGEAVDCNLFCTGRGKKRKEAYLPFDMIQPCRVTCQKCGSPLNGQDRCSDETCPFSEKEQDFSK